MNQPLSAAHRGYQYQDLVVSCALVAGLVESFDRAIVDSKRFSGDRFDDLEMHRHGRSRRIQIKSHTIEGRRLELPDLTTCRIQARVDTLMSTFTSDPDPADEYRLAVTYGAPQGKELADCLVLDQDIGPLLPHVSTQRYRVDPEQVWPLGREPLWPPLKKLSTERDAFLDFCERFVIETGLPEMSTDLREPGPLELVLLRLLREDVGIGLWPNKDHDPVGAAAALIQTVTTARSASHEFRPADVVSILAIRTDYGRVAQRFPVDDRVLVQRSDALDDLARRIEEANRLLVVGSPGSGKSWALTELASRARDAGHLVATHYCYLDLSDDERLRRTEAETMWGSLIAGLLDAVPALASDQHPRYAAGPRELEQLVAAALERDPCRRVILIVDGLDHVSRARPGPVNALGSSTEIAIELAAVAFSSGATLVVGSQPGAHLDPLLDGSEGWQLPPWDHKAVASLVEKLRLPEALSAAGIAPDSAEILVAIADKAAGNPLYATYLSREILRSLERAQTGGEPLVDLVQYVEALPACDTDLARYYEWLLQGLEAETGTPWLAELLASIDFAVDRAALHAIKPEEAHRLPAGLVRLQPVLRDVTGQGGLRIYHESFQRFIRTRVQEKGVRLADILDPVIRWLDSQGFLQSSRAFRFLLPLLAQSGRGGEVLERVGPTFVADSIAHGHPGAAVHANLAVAGNVASELRDWPSLVRFAQLARAAQSCYDDKLIDGLADLFGRALADLHSPQQLSDRLLFDGRPTFPPRTGLLLCAILDEVGVVAPWSEYRRAHDTELKASSTQYGRDSNAAVELARVRGWLRSRIQSQLEVLDPLVGLVTGIEPEILPGVMRISGDIGGLDLLRGIADRLPTGEAKALCHLELARREAETGDAQGAARESKTALDEGIPLRLLADCLSLGADPGYSEITQAQLLTATRAARDEDAQHHPESVAEWISLVRSAAQVQPTLLPAVEDELKGEGWYLSWLRFVVGLAKVQSGAGETLPLLAGLAKDTNPFKGKPRACDLYGLWGLIHETIGEALGELRDDERPAALEALLSVSEGTTTWLAGEANGPLTVEALITLLCDWGGIYDQPRAALDLASRIVDNSDQNSELYEAYASRELMLARLHNSVGDTESAQDSWCRAAMYLAGYGRRRDQTIFELLDPIPAIAGHDSVTARTMLAELESLVSAVWRHTDGKGTRHAREQWNRALAEIDPAGAAELFARSLAVARGAGYVSGAVERAVPVLLERACDENAEPTLVAGLWCSASGKEKEIDTIFRVLERLETRDSEWAREAWPLFVAAIEGDRLDYPEGLNARLSSFASLREIQAATIDVTHLLSPESTEPFSYSRPRVSASDYRPVFAANATPLEIVQGLKAWSWTYEQGLGIGQLANALGWRLIQLAEDGQRDTASRLLHHAASDIYFGGPAELLGQLGDGLARHGQGDLAALAYVLAYARSRGGGGWLAFGGPECHEWFTRALTLDEEVTLGTLASEVAERATEDSSGMTRHLIECFVAIGRGAEAVKMWHAGHEVIQKRLPEIDPVYRLDHPYRPTSPGLSLNGALTVLLVAFLNHPSQDRKRSSATALATTVSKRPALVAEGIREAMRTNLLMSSVLRVLEIIDIYEEGPFTLTHELCDELLALEGSNVLGFRVLARRLLERTHGSRPLPPPSSPPDQAKSTELSPGYLRSLSRGRLERTDDLWPDFTTIVSRSARAILHSDRVKEQMRQTMRAIQRPSDPTLDAHVWYIADELFECVLHTCGSQVRAAVARAGRITPQAEQELASILLDDIDVAVRYELSRTIRPPESLPSTLQDSTSDLVLLKDGSWVGWYRAGHIETELVLNESRTKVVREVTATGGITFPVGGPGIGQDLPLHDGQWHVWKGGQSTVPVLGDFHGPVAGLYQTRHPLGPLQFLCPHGTTLDFGLKPAAPLEGLGLVDPEGNLAVVGRQWRMRPIGSDYVADERHRLVGADLLIRADVLAWLKTRSSLDPVYIRRIVATAT